MFCPNCGNQINDNSAFCPSCGTKLANQNPPQQSFNPNTGYSAPNMYNSFNSNSVSVSSKNTMLTYIASGLMALSAILSLTDIFSASVSFMGVTASDTASLFETDGGVFAILFLLIGLASAALMALPIFMHTPIKTSHHIATRIHSITSTLIISIITIAASQATSYGTISLSVLGWLFVLANIAGLVLSFVITSNAKKGL